LKVVLFLAILRDFVGIQRIPNGKVPKNNTTFKKMDGLYNDSFVVAVWAMAEGRQHRVHVKLLVDDFHKGNNKWVIYIRRKAYEEGDAVSEGTEQEMFVNFQKFWVSRVVVQLFEGDPPPFYNNWDEILEACQSCIVSNTRRISAIRARNTIAKKRADAAAAARANPPIPLYEFQGVGETMAQTRARQKAGLPLLNAEGRTMQEEYAVQDARRAALTPAALPL
jgi:hypothetical protein